MKNKNKRNTRRCKGCCDGCVGGVCVHQYDKYILPSIKDWGTYVIARDFVLKHNTL